VTSNSVVLLWQQTDNASYYQILRNGATIVYNGSLTYTEDKSVQAATTYSYELKVMVFGIGMTPNSVSVLVETLSSNFANQSICQATKGIISHQNYKNMETMHWSIQPAGVYSSIILRVCTI